MSEGTEHHLEPAEHAQHAAHDPFDRRVAMTMAITAAVLALATMLSHRSHNQVLQLQGEAGQLRTQATTFHTQASDQWGYFQAKKQRMYLYGANADLAVALGKPRAAEKAARAGLGEVFPVSAPTNDQGQDKSKKPKTVEKNAKNENAPTEPIALAKWWKGLAADYKKEVDAIEGEARALVKRGEAKEKEAEHKLHESHHVHLQADRLDFGHLGLEMGLVLFAVALLTKQKGFWLTGMGVGILGACVALSAFLL
jgi:Domain of unknown function (DUF4337)